MMANRLEWKGNWKNIKGKMKEQYGQLTDNDLMYEEGREDQFFGNLQQKLGKGREELERMFDDFSRGSRY